MANSSEIQQIVQEVLNEMTLKEKVSLASLEENEILFYHSLFDKLVSEHLGQDDEIGKDIVDRIWDMLKETHRVRCVK